MNFKLKNELKPSGDQPKAIKEIVNNIMLGEKNQVLLGATGTGKTFTMANIIQSLQKSALIMVHNKTVKQIEYTACMQRATLDHSRLSSMFIPLLHPITPFPKAASSASCRSRTKTNSMTLRISGETSCSTSFRFAYGRITLRICARWAPRT